MPHWVNTALPHRQRGFGLLQQALAVAVLVIVMVLGLQLMLPLRGAAERAHVQTVTGGLQSALGLETVRRILTYKDLDSLQGLHSSNPVLLLEEPPLNYRGELTATPKTEIARGQWYFDTATGQLAYQLRYPQYLCEAAAQPASLRWQVTVQYEPGGQPRSVSLRSLDRHRWLCQQ